MPAGQHRLQQGKGLLETRGSLQAELRVPEECKWSKAGIA